MEINKQALTAPPMIAETDLFVLLRINQITNQLELIASPRLHKLDILAMSTGCQQIIVAELQKERQKRLIVEPPPGVTLTDKKPGGNGD